MNNEHNIYNILSEKNVRIFFIMILIIQGVFEMSKTIRTRVLSRSGPTTKFSKFFSTSKT